MIDNLVSGLIGAVLGAVLGAILGSWCTSRGQYYYTKKHTEEIENKKALTLARALYIELSSLWDRYMHVAGNDIEKTDISKGAPLTGLLDTSQNYFIIFDNSSSLLRLFPQDIAEKVLKTYINGKAFLDELIYYGKLTHWYIETQLKIEHGTDQINNIINPQILAYFEYLKKRHVEVKELFKTTIEMLEIFYHNNKK